MSFRDEVLNHYGIKKAAQRYSKLFEKILVAMYGTPDMAEDAADYVGPVAQGNDRDKIVRELTRWGEKYDLDIAWGFRRAADKTSSYDDTDFNATVLRVLQRYLMNLAVALSSSQFLHGGRTNKGKMDWEINNGGRFIELSQVKGKIKIKVEVGLGSNTTWKDEFNPTKVSEDATRIMEKVPSWPR